MQRACRATGRPLSLLEARLSAVERNRLRRHCNSGEEELQLQEEEPRRGTARGRTNRERRSVWISLW